MATESEPRTVRWQRGRPIADWTDDERPFAALLDALTHDLVTAEATQLELDARARRSMADVAEEQRQIERDQLAEARHELAAFREALRDARARGGELGTAEVPYDTARPDQDERAGLLIQYLVRPGYAEVRTEEPEPGHHIYYLRIAWDRLNDLAGENVPALAF
jgi:hypothetical protein